MTMIGNALALGLVSGANIQDGTVDTADIKDAAVTFAKLSAGRPVWDANGNLGLNVTPSAWTAFKAFELGANGAGVAGGAGQPVMFCNATYNSGWKYTATNPASNYDQLNGVHRWFYAPSGTAGAAITFVEGMRLDTTGKLAIGLAGAAPNAGVNINHYLGTPTNTNTTNCAFGIGPGGVTNPILGMRWTYMNAGITGNLYEMQIINDTANANAMSIYTTGASPLAFGTNSTERVRIDGSGWLCIGVTAETNLWSGQGATNGVAFNPAYSSIQNSTNTNLYLSKKTGYVANGFVEFYINGSAKGSINTNGTNVAFNTSSDCRLKTDMGLATDTSVIDDLEIRDFTWIETGAVDRGVFAQDAFIVKPSAVSVGSDDVNEDGNLIKPWSVDYSKFVPDLIVHAQQLKKQVLDQQVLIEDLTTRLAALEAN